VFNEAIRRAKRAGFFFGVLVAKKQQKHGEMKQSGARSAPGNFRVFGVRKPGNCRGMKQSRARSVPGNLWEFFVGSSDPGSLYNQYKRYMIKASLLR
jgi:hypothetical protein